MKDKMTPTPPPSADYLREVERQALQRPLPMPFGVIPRPRETTPAVTDGLRTLMDMMHGEVQKHMAGMLMDDKLIDTIYKNMRDMITRNQIKVGLAGHVIYLTGGWNLDSSDYVFIVAIDQTGPVGRMHLRPSMSISDFLGDKAPPPHRPGLHLDVVEEE